MSAVFLFPGQGAQAVGMGVALIGAFPQLARRLEQGSDALGIKLCSLIETGPPRALARTDVAQVAIFCLSVALFELLRERGLQPDLLAGHSLGQFSALCASGSVSFDQGLALVVARGAAMHALNQTLDGGMLALQGIDEQWLSACMQVDGDDCHIANRNAPAQIVLAGLRPALRALQVRLQAAGMISHWLDVAGPYHTPLMQPAADDFRAALDGCSFGDAGIALVANSNATVIGTREQIVAELQDHMLTPVDWVGTMRVIAARSPALLVEVGAGRVLKGLALRNAPRLRCMTTGTPAEFDAACKALQEAGCEC